MMRRILILLPFLLAACAPSLPPTGVPPASEEVLLERLAESSAAFGSLEGIAKLKVETAERSQTVTEVLIAEKPDRLRLETLNPFGFGQPLLLMATDGRQIDVLVPGEGKLYRDEVTLENLQRMTRLPLQLTDLVHLLLYQVPVIGHERRSVTPLDDGEVLLTLHGADGRRQELCFDPLLRLVGASYYRGEELLLKVCYGEFTGESRPFPTAASLVMPATRTSATVAFSDLRTNVAIPADRFRLTPPPGVEVLPFP